MADLIVISILLFLFGLRFYIPYRQFKRKLGYFLNHHTELFEKLNQFAKENEITLFYYLEKKVGFMPGVNWGKKMDWNANLRLRTVEIPVGDLVFLSKRGDQALIDIRLAGELGHIMSSSVTERISFKEECGLFGQQSCLFDELRSYKTGLEIINRIHGIQNWEPMVGNKVVGMEVMLSSILQIACLSCPRCLDLIKKEKSQCPVKSAISAQEIHIKRILGIKD